MMLLLKFVLEYKCKNPVMQALRQKMIYLCVKMLYKYSCRKQELYYFICQIV